MDRYSIWIIEDTLMYQRTLRELINQEPKLICEQVFDNWEHAVELLDRKLSEKPDVVLLDIGLKGQDGVAGVEKIKSLSPETKIIMFTVYEENEIIFKALANGASGYLLKTSSGENIIHSIKDVMNGGGPMSPVIAGKVLKRFQELQVPRKSYDLTDREKKVLEYLVKGCTKKEISELMYISYHTVDSHIRNIYDKLHVNSKSAAVAKAVMENIIQTK